MQTRFHAGAAALAAASLAMGCATTTYQVERLTEQDPIISISFVEPPTGLDTEGFIYLSIEQPDLVGWVIYVVPDHKVAHAWRSLPDGTYQELELLLVHHEEGLKLKPAPYPPADLHEPAKQEP